MIPVSRPAIEPADVGAVLAALQDLSLSGTSQATRDLEKQAGDLFGGRRLLAFSSGTSALDCAVEALSPNGRDVVVVPALSIISTVAQVLRKGMRLRVLDVDASTFMPSSHSLVEALSEEVAIVIPTHLYGLVADLTNVVAFARRQGVLVLEDAAECFGVQTERGTWAGAQGDLGVFSFYANKFVTGGEGGAILVNNPVYERDLQELRNLGFSYSGERFVHERLGWNARMPGLVAALIASQLQRLDRILAFKKSLGLRYKSNLDRHPWIRFQAPSLDGTENCYWVVAIVLSEACPLDAGAMVRALAENGIEARRFFFPLDQQPCVRESGLLMNLEPLREAGKLWDRGLYLPSGVGTRISEVDQVCEVLWHLAASDR